MAISAFLAAHLMKVFRLVILPTLRQLGPEQTTFLARRADGQPISGWRILLTELAVAVLCLLTLARWEPTRSSAIDRLMLDEQNAR